MQNNFGRETAFFYVQGLALHLYGISFFSLRLASALTGVLAVPLLYTVARQLRLDALLLASHKKPVALQGVSLTGLLAATGLAVSYWHIYFSRLALRAILLLPVLLLLVWCFWQGRNPAVPARRRRLWLVAAGFLLGSTLYIYLAARLLPVLFIAFMLIEALRPGQRRKKLVDLLVTGLATALVVLPLALYFRQNPQAFSSRTQAISILATADPLATLLNNLTAVLYIHFWPGGWLQEWPALNWLVSLGLLAGLPVCLYHLKKPACLFLLLWWASGASPMVLSQQNWQAPTVTLRGITAWPALFLIAAVGLLALARLALVKRPSLLPVGAVVLAMALLIFGGFNTTRNYFYIWAAAYNNFSDHPAYMARYLNSQRSQITLTPLKFYAENVVHFLLQARYPTLKNIRPNTLQTLLQANRPAVMLLPHKSTAESVFVLLVPDARGRGTAYLLPPLSPAQTGILSDYAQTTPPLANVRDSEQEPVAQVYPLPANAAFLPLTGPDGAPTPITADFNGDIRLTGYRVTPARLNPGDTVTLYLTWQARRPVNGDYNLFIHLFNVARQERLGQSNAPLEGLLFDAHRWPPGVTVPDVHYFTLPSAAPDGAYRFEVGLYHAASLQRLPVTLGPAPAGAPPTDDKVILGKFFVGPQPQPHFPLDGIRFGPGIALTGLDFEPETAPLTGLSPGQPLNLTLYWQALAPVGQDYTIFIHLLDPAGNIAAQQDTAPQQGRYPTSWWDAGEIVPDPHSLALPDTLPPGRYTIRLGLYRPNTGERLPLQNEAQDFVDLPGSITIRN